MTVKTWWTNEIIAVNEPLLGGMYSCPSSCGTSICSMIVAISYRCTAAVGILLHCHVVISFDKHISRLIDWVVVRFPLVWPLMAGFCDDCPHWQTMTTTSPKTTRKYVQEARIFNFNSFFSLSRSLSDQNIRKFTVVSKNIFVVVPISRQFDSLASFIGVSKLQSRCFNAVWLSAVRIYPNRASLVSIHTKSLKNE